MSPLPLAEGTRGDCGAYQGITAHAGLQAPSVGITSACDTFPSPCQHPSPSGLLSSPKLPAVHRPPILITWLSTLFSLVPPYSLLFSYFLWLHLLPSPISTVLSHSASSCLFFCHGHLTCGCMDLARIGSHRPVTFVDSLHSSTWGQHVSVGRRVSRKGHQKHKHGN